MRNTVALLLIVLAGLLTLPASAAFWEQRTLMNEDRFVQMGNDVLSKDAVQRVLAREVAKDISSTIDNQIIPGIGSIGSLIPQNDPAVRDLTNLLGSVFGAPVPTAVPSKPNTTAPTIQPSVFEPVVLDVVRTLPNTEVTEIPLRATHGLVVTAIRSDVVTAENDNVVLDLSDSIAQLIGEKGIGLFSTQINGDAGKVVLFKRSSMAPALNWARRFDGNAVLLSLLPLGLLAAGFFLALDRAKYVIYAGIGLALSAGLWILLVQGPLKSRLVDDATLEPTSRAAAEATYDVVAATFASQELIVVGAGVVVFIAGLVLSGAAKRSAPGRAVL